MLICRNADEVHGQRNVGNPGYRTYFRYHKCLPFSACRLFFCRNRTSESCGTI